MSTPLPVSVVIPSYNRADLTVRAVRSAQNQRSLPAEIIVVDDCSTDNTSAAAAAAGARVIRCPENRGEGGARNYGIEHATHDWIAFLDSDDMWLPNHLDEVWEYHDRHQLICNGGYSVQPDKTLQFRGFPGTSPYIMRSPRDVFLPQNVLAPSAVLAHKAALTAVGGFASDKMAADLDMWIRMLELPNVTGIALSNASFVYNVHDGQVSADKGRMRDALEKLILRFTDASWYSTKDFKAVRVANAWVAFRDDRTRASTIELLRATAYSSGPIDLVRFIKFRRALSAKSREIAVNVASIQSSSAAITSS